MSHHSPTLSESSDYERWPLPRPIVTVAVVGAGACGMAVAKHLRDNGIHVRVFERNAYPGGIWKYRSQSRPPPCLPAIDRRLSDVQSSIAATYPSAEMTVYHGEKAEAQATADLLAFAPPGPAYETLKNNIPAPLMSFRDLPRHSDNLSEWYHLHTDHQTYLETYASQTGIYDMTSFSTRVEKADQWENGKWRLWTKRMEIEHRSTIESITHTMNSVEDFDAVVAATGHHNAPATPDIEGLREWQEKWPDRLSHALSFRRGEDWIGRHKVLVIGSGPSGSDMAREISVYVKEVFVTTRPFEIDDSNDTKIVKQVFRDRLAETCALVSTVKRFLPPTSPDAPYGQIELVDGKIIEVDSVLFATGYHHSYPFLQDYETRMANDESTKLVHGQYTVLNLHEDLFYIPNPTLVCLGVPANISAFSFFDYQALLVARVWSGKAQLPSIALMRRLHAARRSAISDRNLHVYGKVEEPRIVQRIADFLNEEATRLGIRDQVEQLSGYSAEYMTVKQRTVEGLQFRDDEDNERLAKTRLAYRSKQAGR